MEPLVAPESPKSLDLYRQMLFFFENHLTQNSGVTKNARAGSSEPMGVEPRGSSWMNVIATPA